MSTLKVSLLGPPRIECAGTPVPIKRRKALALLAYLAVSGQPQRRDTLAALLWPDHAQHAARQALRRDLSDLNLALGGQWLEADREQVGLRTGCWLDVDRFQRHLDECAAIPVLYSKRLEDAVSLYRDDFLAGFTLADAPAFDEWQLFQTETLRQAFAKALERLGLVLAEQGYPEAAIPHARRWLALDPLHEPAHRQLMQLYAQAGQQAAALRQFERCREILDDEFGVPPAPETVTLYEQIRDGRVGRTDGVALAPAPSDYPFLHHPTTTPRHNLPNQTTPFIGREHELAEIRRLLLDEPACRLLNLLGPGGIGKTRLALAAATQIGNAFSDGVIFVSLSPVGEPAFIVLAIAEALAFPFHGQSNLKDQLLDYLSQKQMLLVVDNFEHLLAGADLLSDIVRQAPGVTLLTTSRERLHLQEEWVYEVEGLPFPPAKDTTAGTFDSYAAVKLFLQRARQSRASFAPSMDEMGAIGRICQLVEGMPLGLELAAPWIRTLSCREIAAEIEQSLDFLTTALRNVPEHHRSLRVVFEQTWGRLSSAERSVLMHLSVFRGGCTREAAEEVAGATPLVLSLLVDKALLRRTNLGRYELHELIRQYAAEQLAASGERNLVCERHYTAYLQYFRTGDSYLRGSEAAPWLARLITEQDNLRTALQWALEERCCAQAAWLLLAAQLFWVLRGQWVEGGKWYAQLLPHRQALPADLRLAILINVHAFASRLEELQPVDHYTDEFIQLQTVCPDKLLQAVGCFFIGRFSANLTQTAAVFERGIALARAAGETPGLGPEFCWFTDRNFWLVALLWQFAAWLIEQGKFARATPLILEYQKNAQERGRRYVMANSLGALGRIAMLQGDLAHAHRLLKEAVAIAAPFHYADAIGPLQPLLGIVSLYRGDAAEARRVLHESLRFCLELRDNGYLARVYGYLAELALWEGALDQAEQWLAQSLAYDANPHRITIDQLERLWVAARLATDQERFLRAATLFGLAEQIHRHTLYELVEPVRSLVDAALATVQAALDPAVFAEAFATGEQMSLEQAFATILAPDQVATGPTDPAPNS